MSVLLREAAARRRRVLRESAVIVRTATELPLAVPSEARRRRWHWSKMDWLYKATEKRTDFPATMIVAKKGFLCRSAFNDRGKQHAAHVCDVAVGDTLHFYFIDTRRGPRTIGTFAVIDAATHPTPHLFGAPVPSTALLTVVDATFAAFLASLGDYAPDNKLGVFTGWALQRLDRPTPAYEKEAFPFRRSLVRC